MADEQRLATAAVSGAGAPLAGDAAAQPPPPSAAPVMSIAALDYGRPQ